MIRLDIKNIVIVNDYAFINGGAAKVAINSAIELSKYYDVYFFSAVGPTCEELLKSNVRVICLNQNDINHQNKISAFFKGIKNKKAYDEFHNLLKKLTNERTIVHYHAWNKALSPIVFKGLNRYNNLEVVVTLHDYFSVCPNGGLYNYKKQCVCHKTGIKCLLCNCDKRNYFQKIFRDIRYIVQCKYMKNVNHYIYISTLNRDVFIKKKKNKVDLYYVRNPIEIEKYKDIDYSKNSLYLYVGRISEEKGVDLLCQCLDEINKSAYIIGDGPLLDKLKDKYPKNIYTGWLKHEEIIKYVPLSRALVFPSKWYEGSPLTIIEMQSLGLPVIVSNECSGVENVTHGVDGLCFNYNKKDLIESLMVSDDVIKKMSDNLKNKDFSIYTLDKHVFRLREVYNEIIKEDKNDQ